MRYRVYNPYERLSLKEKIENLIRLDEFIAKERFKMYLIESQEALDLRNVKVKALIKTVKDLANKLYNESLKFGEFEYSEFLSLGYLKDEPLISVKGFSIGESFINELNGIRLKLKNVNKTKKDDELSNLIDEIENKEFEIVNNFFNVCSSYLISLFRQKSSPYEIIRDYEVTLMKLRVINVKKVESYLEGIKDKINKYL